MNNKPLKTKKTTDTTKPAKKTVDAEATDTADAGERIVVTNRSVINTATETSTTDTPAPQNATPAGEPQAAAAPRKRIVIAPLSDEEKATNTSAEPPATKPTDTPGAPQITITDNSGPGEVTANEEVKEETKEDEEDSTSDTGADTKPAPNPATTDKPVANTDDDATKPGPNLEDIKGPDKPSPETQKAVEAAAKREQELKEYIDSHQFFVPLNETERKKSIKVSFGLTFLLFLLGVVLIDLMLDSGIIDLIQKIPHTHFFNVD